MAESIGAAGAPTVSTTLMMGTPVVVALLLGPVG